MANSWHTTAALRMNQGPKPEKYKERVDKDNLPVEKRKRIDAIKDSKTYKQDEALPWENDV